MSQIFTSGNGGGGGGPINQLNGNTGSAVPAAGIISVVGQGALSDGNSLNGNIRTTGSGSTITIYETQAQYVTNYTIVTSLMSPYTALSTDYYIAVSTLIPVTILLPDNPTQYRMFLIKDRAGTAAGQNITITTPGGVTQFENSTSYILDSAFEAVLLTFNGIFYEAF